MANYVYRSLSSLYNDVTIRELWFADSSTSASRSAVFEIKLPVERQCVLRLRIDLG